MKANEAPEKIYLFENPVTETPDDRWLSKRSDDEDIEYTRTDAFIDKACKFLKDKGNEYIAIVDGQLVLRKAIIKDFKKPYERRLIMKLIDKDAVITEILRRRKSIPSNEKDKRFCSVYGAEAFVLTELLDYVENLPVVNIEKELLEYKSFVRFVFDNLIVDSLGNIEIAKNIPIDDKVRAIKKAFEEALKEK